MSVFNQYDDVVHGALYEMRFAAMVRMMGFPLTGSPALALGLSRYKHMSASLLHGTGIPIPPCTELLERVGDVDRYEWRFPLIVQPSQEHAGIGLDRDSIVQSKKALREQVRRIVQTYSQPALAQLFLPGREFNVGIVGGKRARVMPLAEVNYEELPSDIPPIMSYAAKWIETSVEYKKTSVICPAAVEPELARQVSDIAMRAFRAVGAWGYGRVDIRLDEDRPAPGPGGQLQRFAGGRRRPGAIRRQGRHQLRAVDPDDSRRRPGRPPLRCQHPHAALARPAILSWPDDGNVRPEAWSTRGPG